MALPSPQEIARIMGGEVRGKQIAAWSLPTRKPKRVSPADKNWPHDFCCELDAIAPDRLRRLVEDAIVGHVDQDQLAVLKVAEQSERELLKALGRAA